MICMERIIKPNEMNVILIRTSTFRSMDDPNTPREERELNSLEDLIALKKEIGRELIITNHRSDSHKLVIEIYDGYRE